MPPDTENKKQGKVVPQPRDDAYLVMLQRHHMLDTGQLFKGTGGGNYVAHQQRLTRLATVPDGFGRIYIEDVSIPTIRINQMKVYRLTPGGYARLAEIHKLDLYTWKKTDPFIHRYGTSSWTFALDLGCSTRPNLAHISSEDLLNDTRCPDARRDNASKVNPLSIPTSEGDLIPDDLNGIKYIAENKALFLSLELDRRTETTNPRVHKDSIIAKKVRQYVEIISGRTYRAHWGIPSFMPVFWTISETHKNYLRDYVREHVHDQKIARTFLFGFNTRFGRDWRTTPVGYETVSPPGKKPFFIPRDIFVEDIIGTPIDLIDGAYDLSVPH